MGGQSLLQSMHNQILYPPPHQYDNRASHFALAHPVLPTTNQPYPMALGTTLAWQYSPPLHPRMPVPRCPSTPGPQGPVSYSGVPWVASMPPPPPTATPADHQPTPNTQGFEQAIYHATNNTGL